MLIHGRLDLGSPLQTAWDLHRAWPDAALIVVEDAGHLGSDGTLGNVVKALDGFAGAAPADRITVHRRWAGDIKG